MQPHEIDNIIRQEAAGNGPSDEMEKLVTKVALDIGAFEREETDETATDFARRLVAFFVGYFGQLSNAK